MRYGHDWVASRCFSPYYCDKEEDTRFPREANTYHVKRSLCQQQINQKQCQRGEIASEKKSQGSWRTPSNRHRRFLAKNNSPKTAHINPLSNNFPPAQGAEAQVH
jgi:hypothetical protein